MIRRLTHNRALLSIAMGAALLLVAAPAAGAQEAPHCPPGVEPHYVHGFEALHQHLGAEMGDPATCEFADPAGTGDTLQMTAEGLAFWRNATNTPTFTNGWDHWALAERGLVYWAGEEIDPPDRATVVPPPTLPPESDPVPLTTLPPELWDPSAAPDADLFLPPLDGYRTDDTAEVGEVQASLDHAVPYEEVRRRLILDEQGFTSGEIPVVTVPPAVDGTERLLQHQFGDATRRPVEVAGVDMLRIEVAQAHDALAWVGPNFVVTFTPGQEMSHRWLEDVAGATRAAMAQG